MRFSGRTAVVTGAGRGIGREIAVRLASEGAKVAIGDLDVSAAQDALMQIRADGGDGIALACDITNAEDVDAMMQRCVDQWDRLDVLVNNAGITHDAPLSNLTEEAWDTVVDVNLKGTFICLKAAARYMVAANYGRIVNVSSIAYLGNVGTANYSASKGGINALTRTACLELAKHNVTVNAIAPGAIATRLALDLPQKVQDKFMKEIPCHRWGETREIAAVVAFLASDDASYVNGQVIHVCGGLTVGYL